MTDNRRQLLDIVQSLAMLPKLVTRFPERLHEIGVSVHRIELALPHGTHRLDRMRTQRPQGFTVPTHISN
jgi:hypothetical protein